MDIEHQVKNDRWSIKEITNFNIDNIKNEVLYYTSQWLLDISRQNTYKAHKDTEMYQLEFMDYEWKVGYPINITTINNFETNTSIIEYKNICKILEEMYKAKVVRSELVKLKANCSVGIHMDSGDFLKYARRCHIPIITNENVYFKVLNTSINMKEGTCYEINNAMPHGVENNSNYDRVHLIIDLMPNEYLI